MALARGTGPLLSALGAVVILHERMSWISGAGIGMVIGGIAVLTWRPGSPRSSRVRAGVGHGLVAGVTIASPRAPRRTASRDGRAIAGPSAETTVML